MRLVVLTLWMCFLFFSTWAQSGKFSQKLSEELGNRKKGGEYHVVVTGAHQVDFHQLQIEWNVQGLTLQQRRKSCIQSLLEHKRNHQDKILEQLYHKSGVIVHEFWIANFFEAKLPAQSLYFLNELKEVAYIELVEEQKVTPHTPVLMSKSSDRRSVGGSENGLRAIKAPFLWNKGYYGTGTKLLCFDSGLWPDHPTFRDKFLGHHLPLSQAWYGYDSFLPTDKSGSHGTHTTGTCMGLDPAKNDTIGVAFEAYVMATDPIVGLAVDIKPLIEIAKAYQWAMNPDGDTSTVNDIPDVINNSWGHTFDPVNDSAACTGFFANLLIAIEAADIISVQSAGNSGPGGGTVGAPATADMTLVNNFSIGAVNSHNPLFPIASFSSRGPSHCSSTGAFAIKPEVVAPGVNVRSSVRNESTFKFEYGNAQGTSMAAPHVSGMALLLRQAFPNVKAVKIKEAIYYSAVDLGVSGEDNTYGRGMVDLEAAYNYLAQNHTPFPPASSPMDLNISKIKLGAEGYTCDTTFTPVIYFDNPNIVTKSALQIEYGFVGETPKYTGNMSGALQPDDSIILTPVSTSPGWKEFYAKAIYTGAMSEVDYINNQRVKRIKVQANQSLPYREDFEQKHPYLSSFHVEDFDQVYTWDSSHVFAPENSQVSAFVRHSRYGPRNGQKNNLITPLLKMPSSGPVWMTFDLSYQLKASVFNDSIRVWVRNGCSGKFDQLVYHKGPVQLKTTNKTFVPEWIPTDGSDWRRDSIDLSQFAGSGSIMIKIESVNNSGNNLYLDNVNVFDAGGPVFVKENTEVLNWKVFPNPASDKVFIAGVSGDFEVTLLTIDGKQLSKKEFNFSSDDKSIDISEFPFGIYLVKIENNQGISTQKIVKR